MTAQHTPGPWAIDRDPRRGMSWNINIVDKARGHAVCFMAHSGGKEPERDEANARLIAAAPELLEALQEMVDGDAEAIDEAKALGVPFPEEMLKAYRKAIAAIAKATGETQ